MYPFADGTPFSSPVDAVSLHPNLTWGSVNSYDAAILHLSSPLDLPHFPRFRMPVRLSWSIGEPLDAYGFGEATDGDYNTYTDGLRSAVLHITESDANGDYGMARNSQNQELAVGDSGGPSMSQGSSPALVGIHQYVTIARTPNPPGYIDRNITGCNLPLSAPGRTVSVNDWILGVLGIRIDAAALWPQQVSVVPASLSKTRRQLVRDTSRFSQVCMTYGPGSHSITREEAISSAGSRCRPMETSPTTRPSTRSSAAQGRTRWC